MTVPHGPGSTVYSTRPHGLRAARDEDGATIVPNGIMDRLSNGARTGVFLGALALVLLAFFLPGWAGAILLLAIVGALGWLLAQTWPVTVPQNRAMRLIVLLVLLAVAVYKIRP